ncbi:hypothetical protein RFI_19196, partial [Reticulomyxa filosa]
MYYTSNFMLLILCYKEYLHILCKSQTQFFINFTKKILEHVQKRKCNYLSFSVNMFKYNIIDFMSIKHQTTFYKNLKKISKSVSSTFSLANNLVFVNMALTAKDFEVGDYIQLDKENHRGFVRFIGRIQTTGKIYIGVECDQEISNGNNGSLNGTKYFECQSGKGTFVAPASIPVIVRKAGGGRNNTKICNTYTSDVQAFFRRGVEKKTPAYLTKYDKKKVVLKALKLSQSRGRSETKISLQSGRSQSTKSVKTSDGNDVSGRADALQRSASVSYRAGGLNKKTLCGMIRSASKSDLSLNMTGEDKKPKDLVDLMINCLNSNNMASKQRIDIIDKYKHILIDGASKLSCDDAKYAIAEFKQSMQTQVLHIFFYYIY